jgi:hypothetical protein
MKKLFIVLAVLASFAVSAQDSVSVNVKIKVKCGGDYIHVMSSAQTISIPTNVPCPVAEHRILYVDGFSSILGTTEESKLKWYLKDYAFDGMALYRLQDILGIAAKEAQLKAFILDCRTNYGIVVAEAIRGDLVGTTGKLKAYQLSCTSELQKFTSTNLEYEFWNQSDKAAALVIDSGYMVGMYTQAMLLAMEHGQYVGWFPSPIGSRAPMVLQKNSTKDIVHYYRAYPDTTYGKYRIDSLNACQRRVDPLAKKKAYIIFSSEVDFMRAWLQSHPGLAGMKQAEDMFRKFLNRYTNLEYAGA